MERAAWTAGRRSSFGDFSPSPPSEGEKKPSLAWRRASSRRPRFKLIRSWRGDGHPLLSRPHPREASARRAPSSRGCCAGSGEAKGAQIALRAVRAGGSSGRLASETAPAGCRRCSRCAPAPLSSPRSSPLPRRRAWGRAAGRASPSVPRRRSGSLQPRPGGVGERRLSPSASLGWRFSRRGCCYWERQSPARSADGPVTSGSAAPAPLCAHLKKSPCSLALALSLPPPTRGCPPAPRWPPSVQAGAPFGKPPRACTAASANPVAGSRLRSLCVLGSARGCPTASRDAQPVSARKEIPVAGEKLAVAEPFPKVRFLSFRSPPAR